MRYKYLMISPKFLEDMMKGDFKPFNSDLPKDAKIIRVSFFSYPNDERDIVQMVIESKEFYDVPEGAPMEQFTLTMTEIE